jgi:HAD superfamily hydrolase (TIGR01549 family)
LPIEVIIFDLDGTLAAFNLDYKGLRGAVREYLLHAEVPASILKSNESIFDMIEKAEIYFKNNDISKENFDIVRSKCLTIAEEYEMEAATTTTLLTGALETLKELKKINVKIGLCTISSEKAVNYILNRFKIRDYFQIVVSRDGVKKVKPDPEQFMKALNKLSVNAINTVIVGDSKVDMQSAKELKAIGVGLPTGVSTKDQLTESGANYIITSLIDLPALIKKLKNS